MALYKSDYYYYIRQVNEVKLVDIPFSLLCVCVCAHSLNQQHQSTKQTYFHCFDAHYFLPYPLPYWYPLPLPYLVMT